MNYRILKPTFAIADWLQKRNHVLIVSVFFLLLLRLVFSEIRSAGQGAVAPGALSFCMGISLMKSMLPSRREKPVGETMLA